MSCPLSYSKFWEESTFWEYYPELIKKEFDDAYSESKNPANYNSRSDEDDKSYAQKIQLKIISTAKDFSSYLKSDSLKYENEKKKISKGIAYDIFHARNLEISDFKENSILSQISKFVDDPQSLTNELVPNLLSDILLSLLCEVFNFSNDRKKMKLTLFLFAI